MMKNKNIYFDIDDLVHKLPIEEVGRIRELCNTRIQNDYKRVTEILNQKYRFGEYIVHKVTQNTVEITSNIESEPLIKITYNYQSESENPFNIIYNTSDGKSSLRKVSDLSGVISSIECSQIIDLRNYHLILIAVTAIFKSMIEYEHLKPWV